MAEKAEKVWGHSKELRLLITQKCNFKCAFCHGEGYSIHHEQKKECFDHLDYSYLYKVCKKNFGWNTVTISGGEPLLRKDACEIAKNLFQEGANIKLVTNGYLLGRNVEIGKYLNRVNVSLNIMDDAFFKKIVQTNCDLESQLESIKQFKHHNSEVSIMLNSVLLSESLKEDVLDKMIQFSKSIDGKLKFIEIYPKENKYFIGIEDFEKLLIQTGFHNIYSDYEKKVYSKDNVDIGLTKVLCATAKSLDNPGKHCKENSSVYIAPDGDINYCNMSNVASENIADAVKSRNEDEIVMKISSILNGQGRFCSCNNK